MVGEKSCLNTNYIRILITYNVNIHLNDLEFYEVFRNDIMTFTMFKVYI